MGPRARSSRGARPRAEPRRISRRFPETPAAAARDSANRARLERLGLRATSGGNVSLSCPSHPNLVADADAEPGTHTERVQVQAPGPGTSRAAPGRRSSSATEWTRTCPGGAAAAGTRRARRRPAGRGDRVAQRAHGSPPNPKLGTARRAAVRRAGRAPVAGGEVRAGRRVRRKRTARASGGFVPERTAGGAGRVSRRRRRDKGRGRGRRVIAFILAAVESRKAGRSETPAERARVVRGVRGVRPSGRRGERREVVPGGGRRRRRQRRQRGRREWRGRGCRVGTTEIRTAGTAAGIT